MPASDEPAAPAGPHLEPDGDGGFRYRRQTFTARVDRDGTVHIHDKPNIGIDGVGVNGQGVFSLSGHFDLTDALMRLHGEDPYRYEKMAFLDSTREERAVMAARDRTERLHDSISALPSYLDHIWTERKWTSSERRAFLFSLWDEAAEDGDDEIATAGAEARATIIDFIRRRVPADGPDAYSPDEVEAFNARRRSKAPFAPYAR